MKTIYLDNEFRCHSTNDGTMTPVDTELFDNKCDDLINGYRYVPAGESWTREDGEVFDGEMIAPFVDFDTLDEAQRNYEWDQLADMKQALAVLGVTLDE